MEYFFSNLIAAIPWFLFYTTRKDLRKAIFTMSVFALPIALFDLVYVPAYWKPVTLFNLPIGIEGILFSFFVGGVATVAYPVFTNKKFKKITKYRKPISLLVLLIILPIVFVIKYLYLVNIEIAMYFALLIGIFLTFLIRRDLLKSSIVGGIVFGIIYATAIFIWSNLFPSTNSWFIFEGMPRIFIVNAPLYEILFGFLFGAYWGNLYPLLFGYKFKAK